MPQDLGRGRNVGHLSDCRAVLMRAAVGIAFLSLVAGFNVSTARAGDANGSTSESAWSKFMQTLGLKKKPLANPDLQYTDRSPLVVPPTRDLRPPVVDPAPGPDWPRSPAAVARHRGAQAKPSGIPVANAAASMGSAAQAGPVPAAERPSIFSSLNFFKKEEYARFTAEPPRENLTDPPAGYRTPSPAQPYGISPDNKNRVKTGADGTKLQTGSNAGK